MFPTQWKESFGLAVREALARNVWVIATDAGGVVEDLIDGENATIIPLDGDYVSLRKAIVQAIEKTESCSLKETWLLIHAHSAIRRRVVGCMIPEVPRKRRSPQQGR